MFSYSKMTKYQQFVKQHMAKYVGSDVPFNQRLKAIAQLWRDAKAHTSTSGGVLPSSTSAKNKYFLIPDMSVFLSSPIYKNDSDIITKIPPVKADFTPVVPYKKYRIVVAALSSRQANGYHTVYTIDSDRYTYDDICQELKDLGAIDADDYGQYLAANNRATQLQRLAEDTEVATEAEARGYSKGRQEAQDDEDNSAWGGFKKGFLGATTLGISLGKELAGKGLLGY
jgi:hypothetical protein